MVSGSQIVSLVSERQNLEQFRKKNWEGTFDEYLDKVHGDPLITRNAFERVYDMIMSYGCETYEESRGERRVHYHFFDERRAEIQQFRANHGID